MKPETVNRKAIELLENDKITARLVQGCTMKKRQGYIKGRTIKIWHNTRKMRVKRDATRGEIRARARVQNNIQSVKRWSGSKLVKTCNPRSDKIL